jgi:hypothetical protein
VWGICKGICFGGKRERVLDERCVDVCLGKVLLPHVDRHNPGSWISKRNRAEKGGHMSFFLEQRDFISQL